MEQTFAVESASKRVYKDKSILAGTLIGGPLAAGYLMAENFKAFGEADKARMTWMYTIMAMVVIFGTIYFIPDNVKIPNQIFPLIYTGIAYYLVKHFQEQKIAAHVEADGKLYSWGRTIAVGILSLLITLISIVAVSLSVGNISNKSIATKTYGIMNHEIAFDKNNISEPEVDKLAAGLIKTAFFDEAVTKFVYVKKVDSVYQLSISVIDGLENDEQAMQPFIQLRGDLQSLFPNNKITFNLVVNDLNNVVVQLK